MKTIAVVYLLVGVGCGGAPFQYVAAFDAGGLDVNAANDTEAASDVGVDVKLRLHLDANVTDVKVDAADAGVDVVDVADAKNDADATGDVKAADADASAIKIDAADASNCTPIPATTYGCGSSLTTTPTQYCESTNTGLTYVGYAMPMPSACQCAETFTCACLLANAYLMNPNNLCAAGSYQRCVESMAPLEIGIICQ